MTSPSLCPHCHTLSGESIKHLFKSDDGEYFACMTCHYVWLLRGSDLRVVDVFKAPRAPQSTNLNAR